MDRIRIKGGIPLEGVIPIGGAKNAAILFSVTSTCHRHRVDSFAYLHDLLQRLAHDPQPAAESLRAWLPDRWRPPSAFSPASA